MMPLLMYNIIEPVTSKAPVKDSKKRAAVPSGPYLFCSILHTILRAPDPRADPCMEGVSDRITKQKTNKSWSSCRGVHLVLVV